MKTAMKTIKRGSETVVTVSVDEIAEFASRYPCSGMRNPESGMQFTFDSRGDLVDIEGEDESYYEGAVSALADEARSVAAESGAFE
jgi:hypothetical protein